jgi:DNA-binding transcriptional LysR family regulator
MALEPDELRSFLMLASELHFRKAADRLFVSQPALSKQIRKLEEKTGGALFVRTRRRVALTEAGRVLIPLAERLLRDSQAALDRVREAAEGRAGTLRIGFGIASASEILPQTILRFRRNYPGVEIQMRDMSTPAQTRALLEEQIDVGIVRLPVAHPELVSLPLIRERLVVAVPRGTLYKTKEGLACLRNRPFLVIARTTSTTFYGHVLAVCRHAGFLPEIIQEANETFTILNLVRAGIGVSLVPRSAMRMNVPGVRFHQLHMAEAEWQIGIAWNKLSEKPELIKRFSDTMRSVVA